jgi:hypothetical protein
MRLSERSTVLLPQPEGPMMAVIFWRSMFMLTSFTARKAAVVEAHIANSIAYSLMVVVCFLISFILIAC